MLTNQEVFDKVVAHAVKMLNHFKNNINMAKCTEDNTLCLYHHKDGIRMCFIGCLIPDELYNDHMKNKTVSKLFTNFPEVMEKIELNPSQQSMLFLKTLQVVHDNNQPCNWINRLQSIAEEQNLQMPQFELKEN